MTDSKEQDSNDGRTEGQPEPLRYSIIEMTPESASDGLAQDDQQTALGEKTAEKPQPLRYSVIEPATEIPKVPAPKAVSQKKAKAEKPAEIPAEMPEAKPEPPRYAIVEAAPEGAKATPAKPSEQDPSEEKPEEEPEPARYAIIEPPPPPPTDSFLQASLHAAAASADAKAKQPAAAPATAQPPAKDAPKEGGTTAAKSPAKVYMWAAVVGLGILFGCVIAVVLSRMGAPEEQHDWGSTTSDSAGLKGHLFTKWDKKLEYRLTLGPNDAGRLAGFALAVAHPPRPLSIEIHLQDSQGFVLCSREIVLKYDAGNAPAPAASNPEPQPGTADAANAAGNPPAHAMEELLAAQEAERELGKDVFKNELGADGQVSSIDAQGEFPCSEKAYGSAFGWSFTPNFPTVAEQDELFKAQAAAQALAASPPAQTAAARRKAARVPAPKLLGFSIEGDDAIVDFDTSRGVIETRAGKTFIFDKKSGEITNFRWQDYPVNIHYVCDQSSACTITHSGAGGLRVRMSR
jgi:hypothetical protein